VRRRREKVEKNTHLFVTFISTFQEEKQTEKVITPRGRAGEGIHLGAAVASSPATK
jgi:hypothetical protein